MLQWSYYTYWSGLPVDGFEIYIRPDRGWAAVGDQRRPDDARRRLALRRVAGLQGRHRGQLPQDARARPRVRRARPRPRRARSGSRAASVPNFFRKPYGPGWALVGDAGYNKDPITAQGISDAFRDAELCAAALDESFSGERSFDDAMADYQRHRDAHVAADLRVHDAAGDARAAAAGDAAAARRGRTATRTPWTRSSASSPGTVSPVEFFDPADIGPAPVRDRGCGMNDLLWLRRAGSWAALSSAR